jgi:hypothetical protein
MHACKGLACGSPETYKKKKIQKGECRYPQRECMDNCMPACASCNINKHAMKLEEYRQLVEGFMKHLNERNTQYKIAKRFGLVIEQVKPVIFFFEQCEMEKKANNNLQPMLINTQPHIQNSMPAQT